MKTMVTGKDISVLHHEGKQYRPSKKGEFEIEDHHVAAVRAHGLELVGEREERARLSGLAKTNEQLAAENEALKTQLAEALAKQAK
jgi:hypothetical protein